MDGKDDNTTIINKSEEKSATIKSEQSSVEELYIEDEKVDADIINSVLKQMVEMSHKIDKKIAELQAYKSKYKINNNGSITFWPTPNCKPSKDKLKMKKISDNLDKNIECHSDPNIQIVATPIYEDEYKYEDAKICSFIEASLEAWSKHYPFRFKPEHIWLLILQGIALHVDKNAEKLRDKYVMHQGKLKLLIDRDDFMIGSKNNDWVTVINGFIEQIDKHTVKDTMKLLDIQFSSTTLIEKIAGRIAIMDICNHYFSYHMRSTTCGFPEITIDGTKQDWINLKQKCEKVLNEKVDKTFGKWWGQSLLPLIDRFIIAFDGNIDSVFWNSMIKRGGRRGSGAYTYYTGWINIFYPNNQEYCVPYSMDLQYVTQGFEDFHDLGFGRKCDEDCKHGGPQDFPIGLSSAPVEWMYLGKKLELKFIAGFVGYLQDDETGEICPNVSWCIAHKMTENELQEKNKNRGWPF
eukprot:485593_1